MGLDTALRLLPLHYLAARPCDVDAAPELVQPFRDLAHLLRFVSPRVEIPYVEHGDLRVEVERPPSLSNPYLAHVSRIAPNGVEIVVRHEVSRASAGPRGRRSYPWSVQALKPNQRSVIVGWQLRPACRASDKSLK